MNKLDKYGFENPLEQIGIYDVYNVDELRKKCDALIVNIKSTLHELNKKPLEIFRQRLRDLEDKKSKASAELSTEYDRKLEDVNKEINSIHNQRKKWYDDLDTTSSQVHSTEDISQLIFNFVKLSSSYLFLSLQLKPDPEMNEYKKLLNDLSSSFRTPDDVKKYLIQNLSVIEHVDTKRSDLSEYAYNGNGLNEMGYPDYIYGIKPVKEPIKLVDFIDEAGTRTQSYIIGRFGFGKFCNGDHYTYSSDVYNILTILKSDKGGTIRKYNGITDENFKRILDDQRFLATELFSDLVMSNAEKNNFGYIGHVFIDEYGQKRIIFNNTESYDLVTALSYAQKFPDKYTGEMTDRTLPNFYRGMNNKVLSITDIKEFKTPDYDEGGKR